MLRLVCREFNVSLVSKFFGKPSNLVRAIRYQAYDAAFDRDDLAEARRWHASFEEEDVPKGRTGYSRSSGPGGQNVNKTESKAITVWSVEDLSRGLPKLVRLALRSSRYYTKGNDSITIQAQTHRRRSTNTDDNHRKLAEELRKIYKDRVPEATSSVKVKKCEDLEKSFREWRLGSKKQQGAKKASRKGKGHDE
ncbi:hypothetical protein GGR54DRAFT_643923 [Hypoxylon sp. NC1633]|nr:hypothetical protein GGR54DRAFT_643923 [Hypoxylon sp. NC1633]